MSVGDCSICALTISSASAFPQASAAGMRFLRLGLISVLCVSSTALHESEVGIVDWHKHLIGVPLSSSTSTAPVFHRVGATSTKSVVITATGNNVLAALNPVNGSVGTSPCHYSVGPHNSSFYI